jgi:aromatic-L-amino-acid decarboxylase
MTSSPRPSPLDDARYPLEPPASTMAAMVEEAMRRIIPHIESLPELPAADTDGGAELARSLQEDLPEAGMPYEELLDDVFRISRTSFTASGPGYLAYIPGGGLFHSAVADLVASAVNRYVGVWAAAPGLVQLEANVIRWFCQMVGYPAAAGGFLTSGGSLANFSAVVTARRQRLPDDFLRGTIYASDQVHHSVLKAAMLAGFPAPQVRSIPTDDAYRIRIDALRTAIEADRNDGWTPFLLVGSAGTTNTGAVDDLAALADVAGEQALWLHVDAAYGGFFNLTDRGHAVLTGLERSDSLSLDPHKGLFLPYGTGSLLVRDRRALREAHAVGADYMPPIQNDEDFVDFCEVSPELSRPFRGLAVWLPVKMHGIDAFRRALDEKLDLSRWIAGQLESLDHLEVVSQPQLTVTAFGVQRPGWSVEHCNDATRRLIQAVNRRQRVYLTGTMLSGRYVIRICVLSFRTHRDRIDMCLEDILEGLEEVLAGET